MILGWLRRRRAPDEDLDDDEDLADVYELVDRQDLRGYT